MTEKQTLICKKKSKLTFSNARNAELEVDAFDLDFKLMLIDLGFLSCGTSLIPVFIEHQLSIVLKGKFLISEQFIIIFVSCATALLVYGRRRVILISVFSRSTDQSSLKSIIWMLTICVILLLIAIVISASCQVNRNLWIHGYLDTWSVAPSTSVISIAIHYNSIDKNECFVE